jgi:hypothetical protein
MKNLIDIDGRDGNSFAFARLRKNNSSRIPYCFPLHRGYAFFMPLTIELTPESCERLMRAFRVINGDRSFARVQPRTYRARIDPQTAQMKIELVTGWFNEQG